MSPCATARKGGIRRKLPGEGAQRREDIGDDMPAVEMMLGHAPAMEQVAWQALENGALKPAPLEKIGEEDTNKENDAPEKIDAGVRAPGEKVPDEETEADAEAQVDADAKGRRCRVGDRDESSSAQSGS